MTAAEREREAAAEVIEFVKKGVRGHEKDKKPIGAPAMHSLGIWEFLDRRPTDLASERVGWPDVAGNFCRLSHGHFMVFAQETVASLLPNELAR